MPSARSGARSLISPATAFAPSAVEVRRDDVRPLLREPQRRRPPDPARRADHQRHLAVQLPPRLRALLDLPPLQRPVLHLRLLRLRDELEPLDRLRAGHHLHRRPIAIAQRRARSAGPSLRRRCRRRESRPSSGSRVWVVPVRAWHMRRTRRGIRRDRVAAPRRSASAIPLQRHHQRPHPRAQDMLRRHHAALTRSSANRFARYRLERLRRFIEMQHAPKPLRDQLPANHRQHGGRNRPSVSPPPTPARPAPRTPASPPAPPPRTPPPGR